jgi:hypothetical protein
MRKNKKYNLFTDENESSCAVFSWILSLTKEDIDKINYLKEVSEKSWEKFDDDGNNELLLGLDVTKVFVPEHVPTERMRPIESRLTYVGNDEFVVRCNFVDDWDDPKYIITERFKL